MAKDNPDPKARLTRDTLTINTSRKLMVDVYLWNGKHDTGDQKGRWEPSEKPREIEPGTHSFALVPGQAFTFSCLE